MRLTFSHTNNDGSKIEGSVDFNVKKGWYLTDVPLGNLKQTIQYSEKYGDNDSQKYSDEFKTKLKQGKWVFKGESYIYSADEGHYRKDGSILYLNETNAYRRIWYMSQHFKTEEFAIITETNVIVLPSHGNEERTAYFNTAYKPIFSKQFTVYDYISKTYRKAKKINIKDNPDVSNQIYSVNSLVHVHPYYEGASPRDSTFMASNFPFIPMYILTGSNILDCAQQIILLLMSNNNIDSFNTQKDSYCSMDVTKYNVQDLLNHKAGFGLRKLTHENLFGFILTLFH